MSTTTINRADRQAQLALVAELLEECKNLSKKVGVEVLHANFSGTSRSFFHSRFELLINMTPEEMVRVIGYADPVGERAVRRVMCASRRRVPQAL